MVTIQTDNLHARIALEELQDLLFRGATVELSYDADADNLNMLVLTASDNELKCIAEDTYPARATTANALPLLEMLSIVTEKATQEIIKQDG